MPTLLWTILIKEVVQIITLDDYISQLSSKGNTVGSIRRQESADIFNYSFMDDPNYKKVRVLTKNGWELTDAKYESHMSLSSLGENLDYYLMFRPGVHFPVGSYVIIPDDLTEEPNTFEREKEVYASKYDKIEDSQLWFIVGRDNDPYFPKYDVIQCNWEFKWVYDGEILNVFGAVKKANSYTSRRNFVSLLVMAGNLMMYLFELLESTLESMCYNAKMKYA